MERLGQSESSNHFVIEIIEHRKIQELENRIANQENTIKLLKNQVRELENKCGYEFQLNNALIDLLRENRIPFRQTLQIKP